MDSVTEKRLFSEAYGVVGATPICLQEGQGMIPEQAVQYAWHEQLFMEDILATAQGHRVQVVSPGWWNHQAGPDFIGAQLCFNGQLYTGDVEIHLSPSDWKAHGHHLDSRYDKVILHVVYEQTEKAASACTSEGRRIPTLVLRPYLPPNFRDYPGDSFREDYVASAIRGAGACAAVAARGDGEMLNRLVRMAGEWRMLSKARLLRDRMDYVGANQAFYEALLYACGFSTFKQHFRTLARELPYERALQLARRDPLLLESALLQVAGLLPESLPEELGPVPHFERLRSLQRDHLSGLKSLPLEWPRRGLRPNNHPERRIAGVTRCIARTSREGLVASFDAIWRKDLSCVARRRAFEACFSGASGFWASHCSWGGKGFAQPSALLGPGRVRSILGNVLIPAALALARAECDRSREELVLEFFIALPKEPENQIVKRMAPRLFGERPPRIRFIHQQGLLQIYQDWCEHNPSCQKCPMPEHLKELSQGACPDVASTQTSEGVY